MSAPRGPPLEREGAQLSFLEPTAALIQDLIASVGYPGLAVLMALDATIVPVPSAVVMGFAGHLIYLGRFELAAVTLTGALGSTAGSLLMYGLGRWGGRPFADRFGPYLGLSEEKLTAADRWFARHGSAAVLISQLFPVVRDLIPFPAGLAKMSAPRFALFAFLGSLPFCLGLALIGLLSGPAWESAILFADEYDGLFLVGLVAVVVGYLIWGRVRRHPAAQA